MKKLASNLPLQDMIRSVIHRATEKTAADESAKVKNLLKYEEKEHGHIPTVEEEEDEDKDGKKEKKASLTNPIFIEKLASAVEHIAQNIDSIESPQQGVIAQALAKMAGQSPIEEGGSPAGVGQRPGALQVTTPISGKQSYKKDHPKTEDAAESEHGSPLEGSHSGDGKTQMKNNMGKAPGNNSGAVPKAQYSAKGPLVAGPSAGKAKTANGAALAPLVGLGGGALVGHHYGTKQRERGEEYSFGIPQFAAATLLAPAGTGYQFGRYLAHHEQPPAKKTKHASAAQIAKEKILAKLAGEDVMKSNISAKGGANPLAGKGQLTTTDSSQPSPKQPGDAVGGSFGNSARSLIASNQAAINATKGQAKGPVKSQLREVLDEPALSPKTDTTLQQNLRNTGKAGVKIAAAREFLQKVASEGCSCNSSGTCGYCMIKTAATRVKTANAMSGYGGPGASLGGAQPPSMPSSMGGGMNAMASTGESPDGCTCGQTGECRVCKLKSALTAAHSAQ